ncbi:MAG: S8 family serine peptidase [Xanthomonadales bacterium]|nr:S8 family serine peptidase [Xanthomonadales bacterium]
MSSNNSRLRRRALVLALSAVCLSGTALAAERVSTSGLGNNEPVDGFIVRYRDGSASKLSVATQQRSLDQAASTAFGRAKALTLKHERTLGIGAELVQTDRPLDRTEAETLMRQIATNPDVEFVEPNIRLYPNLTPNDAFFNLQYGFQSGVGGSNADQAWNLGFLGAGKIVAVIDTGYRPHIDLNANVINGYDFITNPAIGNDGNGRDASALDPGDWTTFVGQCYAGSPITNSSWHGTHVAGTVAAVTNNATGVAGMAFKAKVLAVRALGRCGGTLADIADAVTWSSGGVVAGVPAVGANKASVINMSLGGGGACAAASAMNVAINGAISRGTTVVVAAGNSNANVAGFTPASCPGPGVGTTNGLIVIGATDSAGVKASFSNFGAGVDVSAPGVKIASTLNAGTSVPGADNYVYYNGTSMSSPHVAGLAALIQSKPAVDCSPARVETLIKTWIKPFGVPAPAAGTMGTGIINAFTAVQNAPC